LLENARKDPEKLPETKQADQRDKYQESPMRPQESCHHYRCKDYGAR
jgi:hypothetical protein